MQAQTQLGECMLYNLAEWAKDQIPQWLEQSIAERSLPAAVSTAHVQAAVKEVFIVQTLVKNVLPAEPRSDQYCGA